jgi:competence protein ComEC
LVWIVCASLYLGRRPASFNALAAAGLVVLAWNPAELFQAGAQLSFLAVATIAWFGTLWSAPEEPDPLRRLISRSRPWPERLLRRGVRWWWRLSLVSAAIWLVALPLVMARFHLVSPVAVVLSPLLWIPVALALSSGVAVLLCGWLLPPLADVFGALCDFNLRLLETAVQGARAVPGSHFWVPGPADWWLAVFYGSLAAWLAFPHRRPPVRWCVGLLAAWLTVGFAPSLTRAVDQPRLQCNFISVGHGAAVLLELPDGRTLLYDAGQLGSPSGAARTIAAALWSRGVTHLDAVVLSHADVDHYCAMPELLKRFSVGVVYVSPFMFEQGTAALVSLSDAIQAAGVPIKSIHSGQRLSAGAGCLIEVLHPPRRGLSGSDNANSIVLAVQYAGRQILLPGDLESPGLEDVLAERPWDCDVLLAPHHGSRLSNPQGLADWCRPEWVVISGGRASDVSDVEQSYRAGGSQVLHTADAGAVAVTIERGEIEVHSFRELPVRPVVRIVRE